MLKGKGEKIMKKDMNKKSNLLTKVKGKLGGMIFSAVVIAGAIPATAFAAVDPKSITAPLENLKTLVVAVIGAVGVIILAKNVMEFAQAYQQQDSSTMNSALKGVVAGILMAGISTVLTFLGF